ncbi:hypothetical protein [Dokdonia sp. Hel_I_53]|uniref:hypothetical protein n=1 Tax=Dokdonia sp. Hel_I_53 TaxID=1566287 RepID=UPI00119AAB50|nr:hypothetical protein [Dokdonia sp. Hel_I_53]TVZ53199.1 hypothetical protein OD90_2398 [Dokdonia sp. Hel_I_53]
MKHYLSILFFLIASTTFAQLEVGNVKLDFGADISETEGNIINIAGIKDNQIYTLSKKGKKFYLQTFASDTKENTGSEVLKLDKINNSKAYVEDIVVIEDRAYVMASYYNKDDKTYNFAALEILEDLQMGDPVTVLSSEVDSRSKKGVFLFEMSYDEINYMITHVYINDRKELLKYEFSLLDADLNAVKEDTNTVSFKDRKDLFFDFADFGVNENGDAFIVYTESYRDKKAKTTKNNITLQTYYRNNNYELIETKIPLDGKRVVNCDLIYTENKVQLVGFYSKLKKSGRSEYKIEGIFDIAVSTLDNSINKKVFNDFTVETKSKLIGERRAKKGKNLKPFYKNTDLIERDNGGVIVLSEYYFKTIGRSTGIGIAGVGVSATPIIYDTNEIIVTALNADGTLAWSNVIPKEQKAGVNVISVGFIGGGSSGAVSISAAIMFPIGTMGDGPEYLSSMPFYNDNKLTVLVNDDPKNIGITNMDDVKKVRRINKMIPVAFEFDDSTGEMTRIDPEDFEKKQIVVRPGVGYQLNNNEAIIYGSNRSETRLGSLKIE